MKTALVQFIGSYSGGSGYSYMYPEEWDLKVNDRVVVDSPSNGYVTARVIDLNVKVDKATKWLVQKVDDREYKERQTKEQERQKIIRELEKIEKKVKEESRFEHLRSVSPEAERLLNALGKF